ncbi:MAG TPA: DUF2911 domain-containing protein [Candidatus Acidoferrum sp.]|jgi:hypothetical protein|nr:DUF2911 domain-containing protein [Candidatus Acidoferrum sp.]
MFSARFVVTALSLLIFPAICPAQSASSSTATCSLADDRQVYIRYNAVSAKTERPPNGKPWTPGGAPMTLFTEAPLTLANTTIPIGAYAVYPIPSKDKWTLVINKNVAAGSAYDEKQDLARATMETDQVPQAADALEIAFAHVGSRCTLRIYFGKAASFADFTAK